MNSFNLQKTSAKTKRHHGSNSLLYQMTALIWSVIVLTIFVFLLVIFPQQKRALVKNLEMTAKLVATSVDNIAVTSIISGDFTPIIEQSMKIVSERKNVLYIVLTPQQGRSIVHLANRWSYQNLGGIWRPTQSFEQTGRFLYSDLAKQMVFHYSYPLNYSGIRWGWINIGISTKDFDTNLRTIYRRTALFGIFATLIGLILAFLFAGQISRPIRSLNTVTKRIMKGDLRIRVEGSSIKEVNQLAASFNQMTDFLREYRRKLIEARDYISNIIQSMNESLIVTSSEGTIQIVNQTTCRLLGYKEEELIGQSIQMVLEESGGFEGEALSRFLLEKKSDPRESQYTTKDGAKIPVLLSISTLKANDRTASGIIIMAQDITARKRAEEELQKAHDELEMRVIERTEELSEANELLSKSLNEKQILLKEIHHRVKNNLQVISSLLYLQSRKIKDETSLSLFRDSQSRVKSMALIHEKLYQSQDLANINFSEYVKSLTKYLLRTYRTGDRHIDLVVNAQDILLPLNAAIPCGLIINELVSNALKYAFPHKKNGKETGVTSENRIDVIVKQNENGKYTLIVRDNGVGFPNNVDFRKTHSLGLQLVNNLTSQLEGNVELNNHVGTEFVITF